MVQTKGMRMCAGAVEAQLLQVMAERLLGAGAVPQGSSAEAAAAAYLTGLSASGRYQRDVWW